MKKSIEIETFHLVISTGPRNCVEEYCHNCSSFYHRSVGSCSIKNCPLHPYRSIKGTHFNFHKMLWAIRDKCLMCRNKDKEKVTRCHSLLCPLYTYRLGHFDLAPAIKKLAETKYIPVRFQ